jgi:16S rRNA (uracil1498-N3)-methyltransferase
VLRVPLEGLAPGFRALTGPVARYIHRVHRLGQGDRLLLFDPALGLEADGWLRGVRPSGLDCEVGDVRQSDYRPYPITLFQGLAKGAKPDVTLRDATALGVERVVFVETERAVVHVTPERSSSRLERWKRIAAEAARQSGRGNTPTIQGPLPLARALSESDASRRIVLAPSGVPLLERLGSWDAGQTVALLVGPEGGLSPSELQLTEEIGFLPASLGSTILRTELAGVAALGALVAFSAARRMS